MPDSDPDDYEDAGRYLTHLMLPLDQVFEACPILADIHSRIKISSAGIFRFKPFEYYHLHTDTTKSVGINMLIEHHHSHCVFVDRNTFTNNNLQQHPSKNQYLLELCYEPGVMYLFNTQIPHMVLNFSGYRYMFSVRFQEPKQVLKYADVVRHLKSLQKKSQTPPTQNKY